MLRLLGEAAQEVRCGKLDPRRGATVMGIVKLQLRVLDGTKPAPSPETDYSGLSDSELLVELEQQAEIVRRRIAAHEGITPPGDRRVRPPTHTQLGPEIANRYEIMNSK